MAEYMDRPFQINSLYTMGVQVTGSAPMRVEINRTSSSCHWALCRSARKVVKVVNRSKLAASFGQPLRCRAGAVTHVTPAHAVKPAAQAFNKKLDADIAGQSRALLSLSGSCQGMELRLDSDAVSFGSVVRNSSVTKRLRLSNLGEIGTRYRWPVALMDDFSVTPAEGYLAPHEDVSFEVTFRPQVNRHPRGADPAIG